MDVVSLSGPGDPPFDEEYRRLTASDSPFDARMGRMILDLLDALHQDASDSRLFALRHLRQELWLQYTAPSGASTLMTVGVDRPDYGPMKNGLPRYHYRMNYQLTCSSKDADGFSIEKRTRDIKSACNFVLEAIAATDCLE